jgi:hypothetical protein
MGFPEPSETVPRIVLAEAGERIAIKLVVIARTLFMEGVAEFGVENTGGREEGGKEESSQACAMRPPLPQASRVEMIAE